MTSFAQPFEMLEACHERIQRMLTLLQRLREHLPAHGADAQAQQAARDVMRYFDLAAPEHHRDEELHVFPPLLRAGDARVATLVRQLQQDHGEMERRWRDARTVLERITQGQGTLSAADQAALDAFAVLHAQHLHTEEEIVYPHAKAVLDKPTVAAMGEEMARRRGVK